MERTPSNRIGIYLAVVQFVFTLTWTVYVIYLPKLAAQAGIAKQYVVYILLADQLIFVVTDYAMGMVADRVSRALGRLAYVILGVTLASCLAFLLLPFAAPQGAAWLFLLLTVLWTVSSSALRAPPLTLIGKYAARPTVPWLSALSFFGLGLAGAVSPYLAITLRDMDPRIPFVASSLTLAAATFGIMWAERTLANTAPPPAQSSSSLAVVGKKPNEPVVLFLAAVLLVGLGFQIHFSLNSAPLYLKHVKPEDLPYLMPVFFIGFNVFMLPASLATRRWGGIAVASVGAFVAALASFGAMAANELNTLIALQFIAGAGWGVLLMSSFSAAIELGHTGREGKLTGGLFSLLALATFARIAFLASDLSKDPEYAQILAWMPVVAWGAGGLILLYLIGAYHRMLEPARA